jgi:hypothetical protein
VLARQRVLTRPLVVVTRPLVVLTRQRVRALLPRALTNPDGTGPQQAAQLAGAGPVGPVARAQHEVLGFAREVAARMRRRTRMRHRVRRTARRQRREGRRHGEHGEPVVRVRPRRGLFGVEPGVGQLVGQQRELMAAALSDGRERDSVPSQIQRHLEWPPGPVPARDRRYGQHGTIYAT